MKHRLHRLVMPAGQLGILVGAIGLSGGPNGGAVLCGILLAATVSPIILAALDRPRQPLRWNVAALYPLLFATAYRLTFGSDALPSATVVVGSIIGTLGCVLVACGVVTLKLRSRSSGTLLLNNPGDGEVADAVTGPESSQVTSRGNELAARMFNYTVIEVLSVPVMVLVYWLFLSLF